MGGIFEREEPLEIFSELMTKIPSGGNEIVPDHQIWESCMMVSHKFFWKFVNWKICGVEG
jgi:hypothetical protein